MGGFLSAIGYGTALFWVLAAVALCAVAIVVVLIIRRFRFNKRLRETIVRIQETAANTDLQQDGLAQLLADTGYAYDWEQNIFYSVVDPWQRKLGYCSLYDDWATPLGLIFDSEPVRFEYKGKKWLIEFWKGQYGITSGGEIGIYNTADPDIDVPGIFRGTFYRSASDEEALDMAFTLYKDNTEMFARVDNHWWLTGFVLGEYADPSALTMTASLTFPDQEMRDAFMEAFRQLGYREDEYRLSDNNLTFSFAEPRSKQPLMRRGPIALLSKLRVKAFVAEYKRVTSGLTNMYDILTLLRVRSPLLYQFAINIGRQQGAFKYHEVIMPRVK